MKTLKMFLASMLFFGAVSALGATNDVRQISNAADRLANAAEKLAEQAYQLDRAHFGNLAIDVTREANQLAHIALSAAGSRNANAVILGEWRDVRAEFTQLRNRWQAIAPNVRNQKLRNLWRVTQKRFQALRTQIRD